MSTPGRPSSEILGNTQLHRYPDDILNVLYYYKTGHHQPQLYPSYPLLLDTSTYVLRVPYRLQVAELVWFVKTVLKETLSKMDTRSPCLAFGTSLSCLLGAASREIQSQAVGGVSRPTVESAPVTDNMDDNIPDAVISVSPPLPLPVPVVNLFTGNI